MNSFITEDFLLQTDFAKRLYHNFAKELPIIDYHNHLSPEDIATNRQFDNCSQVWLAGDHYKWRAMRALGINEKFITGDASDEEKFHKWAGAVPYTLRNPLYHWTHLELERYFGITELLTEKNAAATYEKTNDLLSQSSHSTLGLLQQQNVELLCTTDDPIDSLEHHKSIKEQRLSPKVLPTFRPDKAFGVGNAISYNAYLSQLKNVTGNSINDYDALLVALENRVDYFHQNGCRLADYGLEQIYHSTTADFNLDTLFQEVRNGKQLSVPQVQYFAGKVMLELSKMYHKRGWAQQFHVGAIRNNNKRLLTQLGPDTGFDSIGDFSHAVTISGFLNELDSTNQLAKTIIYNLNPSDNEMIATMVGNFNDGTIRGKVQYGAAWWFLDQKDGMEKQLNTLSSLGVLSTFVGMLTDSRSFLSFPRHEYFRRILCNLLGNDVVNGELPADEQWLGKIVSDICYHNAVNYFEFDK
ncbi:D-glucuronate isomerase [Nonlabens dokdonensis]|uniref:Uronate isomerase n=2 Tax=Nonlabens dokdonensis TaxID=328515 RepID=L7W9B6_NONDD|nr:glucuronate isomerase [Nonlabens dokdonensis]AGC75473.1 glucouronate isomerase [Nonlabens dokdonensis DSW-6]PZX43169.1 D-glucuronate isomerase [Nonlabens dokdonensis]